MTRRARLLRHRGFQIGALLVLALVLFAVLGPIVATHDPLESDFVRGLDAEEMPVGPSRLFWLGADRLCRDQFARLATGARVSLVIALLATLLSTTLGAAVGIAAGYTEGERVRVPVTSIALTAGAIALLAAGRPRLAASALGAAALGLALGRRGPSLPVDLDALLMRGVDVLLAFPFLLLVMAVGAAFESTSVVTILVILGLTSWLGTARIVRSKVLSVRRLEFVVAARALGQTTPRILLLHVLPNVAGPIAVIASVSVAQMILSESVLAYLGAGLAPPTPSWGKMLFEGQDFFTGAPWMLWAPAAFILASVLGFNLVGEGLRDALDPRE